MERSCKRNWVHQSGATRSRGPSRSLSHLNTVIWWVSRPLHIPSPTGQLLFLEPFQALSTLGPLHGPSRWPLPPRTIVSSGPPHRGPHHHPSSTLPLPANHCILQGFHTLSASDPWVDTGNMGTEQAKRGAFLGCKGPPMTTITSRGSVRGRQRVDPDAELGCLLTAVHWQPTLTWSKLSVQSGTGPGLASQGDFTPISKGEPGKFQTKQ